MEYLQMAWTFLNTPVGYMVSGFIFLFILNKIFDKRPGWKKYEGFMIDAVRKAEGWIKDDNDSPILNKADAALQYFIKSYEAAKGKRPKDSLISEVKNGLPIVHNAIEDKLSHKDKPISNE